MIKAGISFLPQKETYHVAKRGNILARIAQL